MVLRPVEEVESSEKKRILYVEDSNSNWEVTKLSLGGKYDLQRAVNATEALTMVFETTYDLVLMDIELAGSVYNGIEITQILRGTYQGKIGHLGYVYGKFKELPIVFVTAYSTRYSKDDLRAVGGTNAVYKPVDFPLLNLLLSNLTMRGVRDRLREFVKKD